MFYFASFIGNIRETLREGVLWFFRNPLDPNFDPFKEMIEVNFFYLSGTIFEAISNYFF